MVRDEANEREEHFVLRLPLSLAARLRAAVRAKPREGVPAAAPTAATAAHTPETAKASSTAPSASDAAAAAAEAANSAADDTDTPAAADASSPAAGGDAVRTTPSHARGEKTPASAAGAEPEVFSLRFVSERIAEFRIGENELYYGALFDLPALAESYKSVDGRTVYKSADVHQVLVVYEDVNEMPTTSFQLNDGLTPGAVDAAAHLQPDPIRWSAPEVAQYEEIIKFYMDFKKPYSGPRPIQIDMDDEEMEEEEVWVRDDTADDAAPATAQAARAGGAAAPSAVEGATQAAGDAAHDDAAPTAPTDATERTQVEEDTFASQLEEELLSGLGDGDGDAEDGDAIGGGEVPSRGADAEQHAASSPAVAGAAAAAGGGAQPDAARYAQRARVELAVREAEARLRNIANELARTNNPVLKGRIRKRQQDAERELAEHRRELDGLR